MTILGIVGDYNPRNRSHQATNDAINHCSAALGCPVEQYWVGTEALANPGGLKRLADFEGLWIAPASPYNSMDGALSAIRMAREQGIPLLGTCGGFQHLLLEYARNVLGLADAQHEETDPHAARLFVSRLACSLVGRTMNITLVPDSLVGRAYGQARVREEYHCNFGLNPEYVDVLRSSALRVVGSDDEGVVRAVELPEHPFFVGTLFLPQHTSKPSSPHPLISAFIKTCAA
jgi:CTP synthase (UTP-ammonia lyase)